MPRLLSNTVDPIKGICLGEMTGSVFAEENVQDESDTYYNTRKKLAAQNNKAVSKGPKSQLKQECMYRSMIK